MSKPKDFYAELLGVCVHETFHSSLSHSSKIHSIYCEQKKVEYFLMLSRGVSHMLRTD